MKNNGDYELSDVPRLMRQWKDSGNPKHLLGARAALVDACTDLVEAAEARSAGLTAAERRTFDASMAQVTAINADLASYKARAVAEHGADMIHFPW